MLHKFDREDLRKKWAHIVARAWIDEKFKANLLAHPNKVLKEFGFDFQPHMTFKVLEETKNEKYLLLPLPPKKALSETDLKKIDAAVNISNMVTDSSC